MLVESRALRRPLWEMTLQLFQLVVQVIISLFGSDSQNIHSGYKAWALFDGTAEAYVHTTLIKKWDICPGDAFMRSYGGKMTRLNGDEIKYG